MLGSIIAKALIKVPIPKKVPVALISMVLFSILMLVFGVINGNIYLMIALTFGLPTSGGFIFNVVYGYCLGRFSKNACTAAGLTDGGMYIASSAISYSMVNLFDIRTQTILGTAHITGVALVIILFIAFSKFRNIRLKAETATANVR